MTIEFLLEESFGVSEDDLMWLENEVLVGDGNLILHSNDVGDTVGVVKKVRNIQYLGNSEPEDKRSVARDDDSSNQVDNQNKINHE